MATPIDQIGQHELNPTLKSLAKARGTTEHADWIRSGDNAALLIRFINGQFVNPYRRTADDLLLALMRANDEEKWGIADKDIARLAATAPIWPKGKHAYLSFRIRFGEGDEGVAMTFERHVARIKAVFTEKGFSRGEHLHSGKVPFKGEPVERLRLLSGNNTHKACVEWVTVDLSTHRERDSVTAVRSSKSLADELLVVTWLFPDMIRAIDCEELPGLFAAGYEVNTPGVCDETWRHVVLVLVDRAARRVDVRICVRMGAYSGYSVPELLEFPALGT